MLELDTGAQGREMTCPRSHSKPVREPGLEPCPSSWSGEYLVGVDSSTSLSTGQSGLPIAHRAFLPTLSHPFPVSLLVRGRDVQGRISRSAGRRSAERAPADHQLERTSLRGVRRQV